MADHTMISDLVSEGMNTIEAQDSVRAAQRRMESQTLRSLIVVEGDRPVGVVTWRDLRGVNDDSLVSEWMKTDFPVLRRDMEVQDAHGRLGEVDFDHIPVIDEEGRLVGEVPRGALVHHESASRDVDRIDREGDIVITADDGPAYDVRAGMDVVGVDDDKLGTVSEVLTDPTTHRASHMLVEHGLLRKKHKRIPFDTISHVDGDRVVLGISKTEFDFLANEEDRDE